ncbi:MAG: DUF4349 domain-containing protein [Defluviitaleaceae bacterium]|nr:DUF4349 domain-containing protein [Defluviitaleaceae bacterium]
MRFLKRISLFVLAALLLAGSVSLQASSPADSQRREFNIGIVVDCAEEASEIIHGLSGHNLSSTVFFYEHGGSAHFRRRVDIDFYDQVLNTLRSLGDVHYENESTINMAAEMLDLQARLTANGDEIARLTAIMADSATLDVLIAVEGRLSQAAWQRDLLMGRINQINNTTAYPYLNINVWEHPPEPVLIALPFADRLGQSFVDSAINLTVLAGDFLVLLASVAIPFALIGGLAALGWIATRRVKKHFAHKEAEAEEEDAS